MIPLAAVSLAASAAEHVVPMSVALPLGQRAFGWTTQYVPVERRVRRADQQPDVATEEGGLTLRCSGRRRYVEIELHYDLMRVPEHLPTELGCAVGPDTFVVQLTNDLKLGYRAVDHATVRADIGLHAVRILGPPRPDGPGILVDRDGQRVDALACAVEAGMLSLELTGEIAPGTYRCLVDGGEPILLEVLPARSLSPR